MPSYRAGHKLPQRERQDTCWAVASLLKAASEEMESCFVGSRMRRKTSSVTHCARHDRTGELQQLSNTKRTAANLATQEKCNSLEFEHLHDWVSDSWHALVKGLGDDCKPPCIGSHQGGKVRHQVDGREVIGVRDLQSLQQRGQAVVAEPECLACVSCTRSVVTLPACQTVEAHSRT